MLFRKSLTRELTFTSVGVFLILLSILLTTQSINMLGRAVSGRIANDAVAALIGFWAIGFYPVLLILTIFISVLVVMTRMWREQEMAIWMTSGMSLSDWVAPVLRYAVPFTLLVAVGTMLVGPWAQQRSKEYAEVLKQREDISAVAPGVFKESNSNDRVYFIENYAGESGSAQNIFVQTIDEGRLSTIFAQAGQLHSNDKGERVLVLENGRRYIGEPGTGNFEVAEFGRYTIKVGESPRLIGPVGNAETRSTSALFASADAGDQAELAWRISLPLSSLVIALLAIPLGYYNARSGHSYNLVLALGVYLLYQNGLWLFRDWIGAGKLPGWWGILPLHLAMLALALGLIYYRSQPSGFLRARLGLRKGGRA